MKLGNTGPRIMMYMKRDQKAEEGATEMVPRLRMFVFAEDGGSVPGTHIRYPTTTCNSTKNLLVILAEALHTYMQIKIKQIDLKINEQINNIKEKLNKAYLQVFPFTQIGAG